MEANPSRSRSREDFSFFVRSTESMMPARTRENKGSVGVQRMLLGRPWWTGMSAEQFGKLFQPFQTTKPNGTGLGLSIGRELLARMSATIAIDSAPHRGTVVDITLLEAQVERT